MIKQAIRNIGVVVLAMASMALPASAQAVLTQNFTGDPSAHYFAGRYYVYATDDQNNSGKYWDSTTWRLLSSKDLKAWKDHGTFLDVKVFKWAAPTAKAWAPAALEYRGKYYFFAPVGGKQIGVAVSHSPEGPFVDAIGKPLVENPRDANAGDEPIDPALIVDQEQRVYMYFGTRVPKVVELTPDLRGIRGEIRDVELRSMPDGTKYGEAPFLHYRGGQYYYSFSTGWPGQIVYATGTSPLGPFTYRGVMKDFLKISTNHHSILERDGKTYFFYHDNALPGGGHHRRSILMEQFGYGPNGEMRKLN